MFQVNIYLFTFQHYSAILEDQLDFHSYCLRKGTLRSYIETIRLENKLRDHSAYFDAASLAIEVSSRS